MLVVRQGLSGKFSPSFYQIRGVHTGSPALGQSMEKKREKAMLKKAGGKAAVKKKDGGVAPTKAKIKMKDAEMLVKAAPLINTQDNLDSIELHGAIQEETYGIYRANREQLVALPLPIVDYIEDNARYRRAVANMLVKIMKMHRLTAMLPVFRTRIKVSIVYGEGREFEERRVYYGNEFGSAKAQQPPNVYFPSFPSHVPDVNHFTLVCFGHEIDNPDQQFIHWIVSNISGKTEGNKLVGGKTIAEYSPPAPKLHGDLHRYVYLLCSQEKKEIDFDEKFSTPEERANFNAIDFLSKYKLNIKGLNFFYSKWHASVQGPLERLDIDAVDLPFGDVLFTARGKKRLSSNSDVAKVQPLQATLPRRVETIIERRKVATKVRTRE